MTDSRSREVEASISASRILVLAPNWLGDVIMAAPLLSLLRETFSLAGGNPCQIILGIRRAWAPLFAHDPRLGGTLILERNGIHHGVAGLWRQAEAMRAVDADAVLLGPPSLRAGLTARLAGIPLRVGTRTDGRGWLLNCAVESPPRGSMHYSSEMLQLGDRLCERMGWTSPAGSYTVLSSSAPEFDEGIYLPGCLGWPATEPGSGPPLWALAPGTTFGQAKTWPIERVVEFMQVAVRDRERRLVLLGDGSAREFCDRLRLDSGLPWREVLDGPAGVIDLTGKTDLPGAVGLLKAAEGFVGNDSGLMHLSGVLGVPTVGIFGSSNPEWTAPAGPLTAVVIANGFPCRPCYLPTCNQPRFCLQDISARTVLASLDGLIEKTLAGGGH